jgi:biotin transport system substrate-specific component
MVLGSKISIPLYPVPITLQTAGMLFIAMTFTPSNAFLSLFSWLMLFAAGLPVLAKSTSSIAMLVGPTAGYFWGMVIAATVMSSCQSYGAVFFNQIFSKNQSSLCMPAMILVSFIGTFIVLGLGWLNLCRYIGAEAAWTMGVVPFLIGDLLKVMAVSGLVSALRLGQSKSSF